MPKDPELTEGVTPVAKIYSGPPLVNKTDPFRGDAPWPTVKVPEVGKIAGKTVKQGDTIKIRRPPVFKDMPKTTTIEHMADEMLNEVVRNAKPNQVVEVTQQWLQAEIANAKPAKLDNTFTTDWELQDLARQVEDRTIANWPMLRRLLNRLLRAEGK
jgi:hypothetical protein